MEYTLEDKVEALKNMLSYNEKYGQVGPSYTNKMCDKKKPTGVRLYFSDIYNSKAVFYLCHFYLP